MKKKWLPLFFHPLLFILDFSYKKLLTLPSDSSSTSSFSFISSSSFSLHLPFIINFLFFSRRIIKGKRRNNRKREEEISKKEEVEEEFGSKDNKNLENKKEINEK